MKAKWKIENIVYETTLLVTPEPMEPKEPRVMWWLRNNDGVLFRPRAKFMTQKEALADAKAHGVEWEEHSE